MAGKSVLELAVGTGKWDSGLRKAQQSLNRFVQANGGLDKALAKNSDNVGKFVKMMGDMNSTATTAKGKMSEYKKAIEQLTSQFNSMSDAQKKALGGDYASTIDKLKGKYREAADEASKLNRELNGTSEKGGAASGIMNQLAGKFSITLDAVKLFNVGLQATQAALQVAKDAFFASEANVDEWGRIVDSSRSLYEGFLNSINNGDISGFLGRIDQIVDAARTAYNELDRLGTMRTIQAPQISAQQTENDRIRQMIQTGRYIAPTDGRKPTPGMTQGQVLTPTQIRRLEQQLTNGMNNVVKLVGNEVQQTGKAIEAIYRRQGAELGMSVQEFKKGTSSMAEFDKRLRGAEAYNKWVAEHTTTDIKTGRQITPRIVPKELSQYKGWDVFRVDGKRYNDLVRLIQQRDQQAAQAYSMQGQAYRTINRAEGITTRSIMGGGRTGGRGGRGGGGTVVTPPPTGSIAEQETKVQALTKAWREATDQAGRDGYLAQLNEAKAVLEQMQGKTKVEDIIPEGSFKALNKELKDLMAQRELLSDPMDVAIMDDQINEVREKIDELNGKTINVAVDVPKPPTLEFQVRTKMAEDAIEADTNTLRNLLETALKDGMEGISIPTDMLTQLFSSQDVPEGFLEDFVKRGMSGVDILDGLINGMFGESVNIPDEFWMNLVNQFNAKRKELGLDTISLDLESGGVSKEGKQSGGGGLTELTSRIGKLTDGVSNITGGLTMMGVKIPEGLNQAIGVIQGLMSVVQGVQTVIQVFATSSQAANTLALGANTAMVSALTTVMAAKTATSFIPFFSGGGVMKAANGLVAGNHMSGDKVGPVMLNSGELILNRAQQGIIASDLEGGVGTIQMEARVYGEDIVLATRNVDRRRGKGEVVRSR